MRNRRTIIAIAAIVILIGIQLVPVDRGAPAAATVDAPADVRAILETSCFDCHSGATDWPWYGYVAPVSWIVAHHVEEGREHVDFSAWSATDPGRRAHWREEIVEMVEEGEMPPGYYTRIHGDARLDAGSRDHLLRWARAGTSGHRED